MGSEAGAHVAELQALRDQVRETLQLLIPDEMWDALTEFGRNAFARDVLAVLMSDDRVEDVIQAWDRAWLLVQDPEFRQDMEQAGKSAEELEEQVYTLDDLRAMLSG